MDNAITAYRDRDGAIQTFGTVLYVEARNFPAFKQKIAQAEKLSAELTAVLQELSDYAFQFHFTTGNEEASLNVSSIDT